MYDWMQGSLVRRVRNNIILYFLFSNGNMVDPTKSQLKCFFCTEIVDGAAVLATGKRTFFSLSELHLKKKHFNKTIKYTKLFFFPHFWCHTDTFQANQAASFSTQTALTLAPSHPTAGPNTKLLCVSGQRYLQETPESVLTEVFDPARQRKLIVHQ